MNELVLINNKPEIDYSKMEVLAKELQNKMSKIDFNNIVVTDDNVKEMKKLRTSVRKEWKLLEDSRKEVEKQYNEPLQEFKDFYKENINELYQNADISLRTLINNVEDKQREDKIAELKEYFEEVKAVNELDFLEYDQLNINVTLSASMTSLQREIDEKVENINKDLMVIETQEHKERILVKYYESLDVQNSITTVLNEVKREEELAKQREEIAEIERQVKAQQEIKEEPIVETAPEVVSEQKTLSMTFTVTGTIEELKAVKSFLETNNIEYKGE